MLFLVANSIDTKPAGAQSDLYRAAIDVYKRQPIINAYQPCLDTPPPTVLPVTNPCTAPAAPYPTDAFVAKLNPNAAQTGGAQLLFSTYLGGKMCIRDSSTACDESA